MAANLPSSADGPFAHARAPICSISSVSPASCPAVVNQRRYNRPRPFFQVLFPPATDLTRLQGVSAGNLGRCLESCRRFQGSFDVELTAMSPSLSGHLVSFASFRFISRSTLACGPVFGIDHRISIWELGHDQSIPLHCRIGRPGWMGCRQCSKGGNCHLGIRLESYALLVFEIIESQGMPRASRPC